MYLWERPATPEWLTQNEERLRSQLGERLAVIERPNWKRLQIQAASGSRAQLRNVAKIFGGRLRKLPVDWLRRFSRAQRLKPLRIGKHLIIVHTPVGPEADSFRCRLIIPAGAAFGTGQHATTAMSLRLLERAFALSKAHASSVRSPNLVVDLGTGTGILALTAARLGAGEAVGIDLDPLAISTARKNARLNKVANVRFMRADVRSWKFPARIDIVTANLFSDLLIEILPKLKRCRWLVLSGVLRGQEPDLVRALKRNAIGITGIRRRGKWVAILAGTGRQADRAATSVPRPAARINRS
jgi:ribosomal protein L11 methyltransferase